MAYARIGTPNELTARVVPGQTREGDDLEFKAGAWDRNDAGKRECARDAAQFANASGGTIVVGAPEQDHVVQGFNDVPAAEDLMRWIGDVLNGQLEPVPPIEPTRVTVAASTRVVAVNVPPSLALIARKTGEGYEFPIRAGDGKRYMTLMEVEARMGNRERTMKLRIQAIRPDRDRVTLDAHLTPGGLDPRDWRVEKVDDHTVTLVKAALRVDVPLGYVEAVYPTTEQSAEWVIAMDCHIQPVENRLRVRKFRP